MLPSSDSTTKHIFMMDIKTDFDDRNTIDEKVAGELSDKN